MEKQAVLYETSKYRCLEFPQKQSNDLFLILCGVEQCLPGYAFHSDHRPGYHLHVILSGKGELRMNRMTIPLHFGQMFITKPEEDIWYQADSQDPWSYCWMSYGGSNAQRHTESAGFVSGVNWLPCGIEQDRFYDLVKRVLDQPNLNRASDLLRLGLLPPLVLQKRDQLLQVPLSVDAEGISHLGFRPAGPGDLPPLCQRLIILCQSL